MGLYIFSSQICFSDLWTSPRSKSVSSVTTLDLTLPPEGGTCFARWIRNCPRVEELTVKCNSKGKEELEHTVHAVFSLKIRHQVWPKKFVTWLQLELE